MWGGCCWGWSPRSPCFSAPADCEPTATEDRSRLRRLWRQQDVLPLRSSTSAPAEAAHPLETARKDRTKQVQYMTVGMAQCVIIPTVLRLGALLQTRARRC